MTYALLVYDRDDALADLSEDERAAIHAEYENFARTVGIRGYRLQPSDDATTLCIHDGRDELSPGPVANDLLQLAGFYLVDSDDPERAVGLARRIPAARLGGVIQIHPLVGE
jgi:hypothetical protein